MILSRVILKLAKIHNTNFSAHLSFKMSKRPTAPWQPPSNNNEVQLKLFNSLTRKKELFVPQDGKKGDSRHHNMIFDFRIRNFLELINPFLSLENICFLLANKGDLVQLWPDGL